MLQVGLCREEVPEQVVLSLVLVALHRLFLQLLDQVVRREHVLVCSTVEHDVHCVTFFIVILLRVLLLGRLRCNFTFFGSVPDSLVLPRRQVPLFVDAEIVLALRVHLRLELVHLLVFNHSFEVLYHLLIDCLVFGLTASRGVKLGRADCATFSGVGSRHGRLQLVLLETCHCRSRRRELL